LPDEPEAPEAGAGDDAGEVLPCPVDGCEEVFTGRTANLRLGQHKRSAHGIAGEKSHGGGRKRTPRSPSSASSGRAGPKVPDAGGGGALSDAELTAAVKEIYVLLSMTVSVRDPFCGGAIGEIADSASKAWVDFAKGDPEFRKRLEAIAGVSYVPIVIAHVPLVQALKAHHVDPTVARMRARRAGEAPPGGGPAYGVGGVAGNGTGEDAARARFEEAVADGAAGG
jgi:hypothetical protein